MNPRHRVYYFICSLLTVIEGTVYSHGGESLGTLPSVVLSHEVSVVESRVVEVGVGDKRWIFKTVGCI